MMNHSGVNVKSQRKSSIRNSTVKKNIKSILRKHKPDYSILTYTIILVSIGLIIIFSISPQRANIINESSGSDVSSFYFIFKQAISILVAVGAFIATAFIFSIDFLKKYAFKIFVVGIIACLLLFILGNVLHVSSVTQCSLGACRWFKLPGFGTLQPAEIVKFGLLLYIPGFLAYRMKSGSLNDINKTLIPLAVILAVSEIFIIVLQHDLGTGAALLSIVVCMLIVSNMSYKRLALVFASLILAGVLAIAVAPHRIARIMTFMKGDESSLSDPSSYHIINAKIAIGTGGLTGSGIGNSIQSAGYLPEAIDDSVFAVLGETFGLLGLVFILAMFFMLLITILKISGSIPDYSSRLIAAGVFGWIFGQMTINIGAMTGLLPLTGITLPFLSFGGTSIVFIALALGLVFQLSQYTSHDGRERRPHEDTSSRRRVGRSRYTSSRRTN